MPTPSFAAQSSVTNIPIRYYTGMDPYYYTIDNRPIKDLADKVDAVGDSGVESARRATLISQLSLGALFPTLYPSEGNASGSVAGFDVTLAGTSLQVGPGALYFTDALNSSISYSTVKQALSPRAYQFTLTTPSGGSNAKDYLVQVKTQVLDASTMDASQVPFVDAANSLLPGLLLNYEAVLSIKEGTAAALGSQVTPSADAGAIPLLIITLGGSAANNRVRLHPQAPNVLGKGIFGTQLLAGNTLAGTGTTSLDLSVSLAQAKFNPLLPVKVKVLYSADLPNNNAAFQLQYQAVTVGSPAAVSYTSTANEVVTMPATANNLSSFVTATAIIPNNVFAGFVANNWRVNQDLLRVRLTRLGSDAADTTNAVVTAHEIQLIQ